MNLPRPFLLLTAAWFALAPLSASAQAPVPEPARIDTDAPVILAASDPLLSLEEQIEGSDFDRRGALSAAFDEINSFVNLRLAALQAQGFDLADEAETNLTSARDAARITFRDLSLTTEETWQTARHNAVLALRKIRGALEDLQRTAIAAR
ncbi:MAG TPA: hypothetical protein VEB66_00370 [Opitutaceae bacterium]|nr:hypothetical protein [Opitutaceae bacterium]